MIPSCVGCGVRIARICLLLTLPTASAFAQESGTEIINPVVTLGKLAAALMVVLVIFWIFAKLMRQVQCFQSGAHGGLQIVGTLAVGQRERIVVIQAGQEQLVLGVTSNQINTLHVLDTPLVINSNDPADLDFKSKLSTALKRQVVK
jgi:flagellar protein FliO/FliZ